MGLFGSDRIYKPNRREVEEARVALRKARSRKGRAEVEASSANVVQRLVERLLRVGIDGVGRFASAKDLAERVEKKSRSRERAVRRVRNRHVKLARAGGFASGLGGVTTMAVALPANVVSFFTMATRMVATIAELRGYDTSRDEVRAAVMLTLSGQESDAILKQAGLGAITGRLAQSAGRRLTPGALMLINKAVGVHLLRSVGTRGVGRLFSWVPLLGGFVGQAMDGRMMRRIAAEADEQFPLVD